MTRKGRHYEAAGRVVERCVEKRLTADLANKEVLYTSLEAEQVRANEVLLLVDGELGLLSDEIQIKRVEVSNAIKNLPRKEPVNNLK